MAEPNTTLTDRRLLAILVVLALAYQWLQDAQILVPVIRSGAWFDTDDAMRMVGVRALLDGQSWFDLTAHRMGGDHPVLMHWSRVVDVPLAILDRAFGLVLSPPTAEIATRLAFPATLLLLLVYGVMRAAETAMGSAAKFPAILLVALGGPATDQFVPGRIDHHAPQIVVLTFTILALLQSFEKEGGRRAAVAGALAALSLSISIENLPFLLIVVAAIGLHWILQGDEASRQMRSFAMGLGCAAPLLFIATVPPVLHTALVCDAFGAPYLLATLCGSAALLAAASLNMRSITARTVTALAGGCFTLGALALVYPICLGDPFVALHPMLREVWLQNVSEARSLATVIRAEPWSALPLLIPPLLAIIGLLWTSWHAEGCRRTQLLSLAALCCGGLVAASWMVRTESSLGAPVMIAGAILATFASQQLRSLQGRLLPILLPLVFCVPMSSAVWATLVPSEQAKTGGNHPPTQAKTCTAPSDFRSLAQLQRLRLLTSLDAGPYILVHTQHEVFAGPYHRNTEGNLASLRTFLARPDDAHEIARAAHATHLAFCPELSEVRVLSQREPEGLAAQLRDGHVPDWLSRVPLDGPWQVFRID